MSPEKRKRRSTRRSSEPRPASERVTDPGPPYEVLWHPIADTEQAAIPDAAERVAIQHAREKLQALGPRLGAPHSSAVQSEKGTGLRELRPRAGRSRWRPIYRRIQPRVFVILAVAPEAQIDKRGFDETVRNAKQVFEHLET
ncbi:MAG TPA: type II toxin-antitoxin system RelE/ParE family toxin [Solirubrobacteraceae bacterium]|nr:type II toxin-antitoxin system RelE/ParE family toxin [Solirubrobacteraceae bacterium]